jgi:tetratricopeptide (TPR) repeat protein
VKALLTLILITLSLSQPVFSASTEGEPQFEWLEIAGELAALIEGDTDTQMDALLALAEHCSDAENFTLAEQTLRLISDHRRVVAAAAIVKAMAQSGGQVDELLSKLKAVEPYSERGNSLGKDRARMAMALALGVCGQGEMAEKDWVTKILDKETAMTARLVLKAQAIQTASEYDHESVRKAVEETASAGPFPGAVHVASVLLERATDIHTRAESKAEAMAATVLVSQAVELASNAAVNATEFQLEAAHTALRMGAEEDARRIFEKAIAALRSMPDGYEAKAALHARWASLWVTRGKPQEATKIIEIGKQLAMEGLESMHRPAALAQLATAAAQAGDTEGHDALIELALSEAEKNPNARVRLLGGMEVCFAYAATGAKAPEEISRRLRALGGDTAVSGDP